MENTVENTEFAAALKGMMDAWDVIQKKVWEKYPRLRHDLKYEMTVRLFEKLTELDKNKGRN